MDTCYVWRTISDMSSSSQDDAPRYDPLARLRAEDWKAYGCDTPGCGADHECHHVWEDGPTTDSVACTRCRVLRRKG
jgi:hypothetical protein